MLSSCSSVLIGVVDRLESLEERDGVALPEFNDCDHENPVPGTPNVAQAPLPEKLSVAPRAPRLMDAPLVLKLSRTPGINLTDRRKRKPISISGKARGHAQMQTSAN